MAWTPLGMFTKSPPEPSRQPGAIAPYGNRVLKSMTNPIGQEGVTGHRFDMRNCTITLHASVTLFGPPAASV